MHKFSRLRTTRLGFITILLALLWAKTLFAYHVDFSLGASGIIQQGLLILNPLGTSALLLSLAMYPRKPRRAYVLGVVVYALLNLLLFANVLYYREFSDFLTIATMLGATTVAHGLGASTLSMLTPRDLVYGFDWVIVLAVVLIYAVLNILRYLQGQKLRWPHFGFKLELKAPRFHLAQAITAVALAVFAVNMAISELNRPNLLTRTFDHTYIVKYLGLAPFTLYDGVKAAQNSQVRASADASDMDTVLQQVQSHYAAPNAQYAGVAKGKNVIIIHLESFQQFLINFKVDGQEVTPFLNSLVKQKDTLSFDNFFNQVGAGKTSDAENMLETGMYGLESGSLFSSLGTDNTFQAAPAILNQTDGYTSAVFHGGNGTFWNRNNVYKSLGYQYFFDGSYYGQGTDQTTQYGIKDKLMFGETIKYMERLQQPFYAKIITTTNHFPFYISDVDSDFPDAGTSDASINGYFRTAHYLDAALKEFFAYLKASGLYNNSLIMMYGDHYGISNDRNQTLAPLLGKSANSWNDFDDASMQRVPLIFHMPNLPGGIKHTYGGEIDVLPTLLHLLGVNTKPYVQFGTDLLSAQHDQTVAFRNHDFVTPRYTVIGDTVYLNRTGEVIHPNTSLKQQLTADQSKVNAELSASDNVASKNLLRFYVPEGFAPVDPSNYDYTTSLQSVLNTQNQLGDRSTSLYSQHHDQSTVSDFHTDAPEVQKNRSALTKFPKSVLKQQQDVSSSQSSAASSSK
ncbi:LTA synthase family protein [Lacticaseibacillus jixiensis]|uniref:LTA synthase family protein n=1 Tax=Lacticaseibacillus jixiensis TaxID=3231926 RepID=UPI0036F274BA